MIKEVNHAAIDPLLLERAAEIRLLALDVDGVLTDGTAAALSATDDLALPVGQLLEKLQVLKFG